MSASKRKLCRRVRKDVSTAGLQSFFLLVLISANILLDTSQSESPADFDKYSGNLSGYIRQRYTKRHVQWTKDGFKKFSRSIL